MDIELLNWLNHHRIVWLDPIIHFITNTAYVFAIAVPVIMLIVGYWQKNKFIQFRAWFILFAMLLAEIVSTILKFSINRTRPFKVYPFIEKLTAGGSPSFPSGHTTDAFVICVSIIVVYHKWQYTIPVLIWAMLVGYSRMALGVHYPTDVLGGIIIGAAAPLVLKYAVPRYKAQFKY
ncbi:MAG: phosphatase PAP2 family protein [Hydrotalea flava]|nr:MULTISPECIES: phosphatase PAP2 family protein [Hydrotalea]MBY0347216.1 phosphatase PAP2 family protein [Hydrotalea flava]NIM34908.1 phosphatase PAP2 family protein [Hydrotalea flava]NIM37738.1 phosphatase PAP2 family protein [Hydrotalea flava]NIN02903.1 phosphatase PAP2 family protein [Hydrotalea flava]NIN14588.1 phosphatase PAP2 family protein [Hydrotalea flava]